MKKIKLVMLLSMLGVCSFAQRLTLRQAVAIAQENSYDAQLANLNFMSKYWTYRSFKAALRPSVNLHGNLGDFDHSLVSVRNYEDGQVAYVDNNSLSNQLTLSLDQQIVATGGTISLQSYLYSLNQFTYDEKTFNSQPLRINYTQPFREFNSLKWEKKTAPLEYEIAKKTYMASMEEITIQVATLFFEVLAAQSDYKLSMAVVDDRQQLLSLSERRLEIGTANKSDVLQMELSLLNAKVANDNNKLALDNAKYRLFSYLRVSDYDDAELIPPFSVPDIVLSVDEVMDKAIGNSSHSLEQRQRMVEAERELARAKSGRGVQLSLHGEIGFSQSATSFARAYQRLRDNEIVGLTLSLPIFDWGVSKGKVRMAQAQLKLARTLNEQTHMDYMQELRRKVMEFNTKPLQCRNALRAQEIAVERYGIMRKRFETGTLSVTELNTAQQELETAKSQYIKLLSDFWTDYYSLQKSTLYDWINLRDISVDFDKLTNK